MGRFTQIPLPHRQAQIDRLEKGRTEARLGTWRRVFAAMFCELLVVPLARPWSPPDRLGR